MRVLRIEEVGKDYQYQFPAHLVKFDYFVEYVAIGEDKKEHRVRICFGTHNVFDKDRVWVVVLIDGQNHAEFSGADDFEQSGEVLSIIRIQKEESVHDCRYPDDSIPERYIMFNVQGLPLRIQSSGVRNAWAVVANIANHKTLIASASLRRLERT